MRVGKEDAMGMLAAVELWVRRDHDAEWKAWMPWLEQISDSVKRVDGVTTEVLQPSGISNHSPRLETSWDGDRLGIYGAEVEKDTWRQDPRIVLARGMGTLREGGRSTVSVMPWQMSPGDAAVAAQALYRKLAKPLARPPSNAAEAPSQVAGVWHVQVDFSGSPAHHSFYIEQFADNVRGLHLGDRTGGDMTAWVEGDHVHMSSRHRWEGAVFGFSFDGKVRAGRIDGEVDRGEYFTTQFSATRHEYGGPVSPFTAAREYLNC